MFQENNKKTTELERLHEAFTFEEILEVSDLTEEEVIEILYDLGYLNIPPFLRDEGDYDA